MGSIPLPALHIQPPQPQENPLEQYSRLLQLKNQMQEAPLRQQALQQQVQGGQLALQSEQQAQQDQQSFRAAMQDPSLQGKTIGEIADALAQKGSISQGSWVAAKKADVDQRSALAGLDEKTLANHKAAHDATQQLYNNVMNLPDDQLAQNWPAIAQQYDSIPGNQKLRLDPNQPMSKQQLAQFAPMISMANSYFDEEMARREKGVELQTKQTGAQTAQADLQLKQQEAQYGGNQQIADSRYRFIQQRQASGIAPSGDDAAFIKGYEKQKLLVPTARVSINAAANGATGTNDIKDTAQMILEGQAPPVLTEYSFRDRTKLAGELHRQGYNLAQAEQDWKATQKYLATLNGSQQTRLRQAITFTSETIPQIQDAFNEWKKTGLPSGFQVFNTAALKAAENLPGKSGSAAHNLRALMADFTSELGTVYKGGNSSTDESLKLAAQNLSAEWNEQTFTDALARIGRSLKIRKNSINAGSPVGVSGDSPYPPRDSGGSAPSTGGGNDPLGIR